MFVLVCCTCIKKDRSGRLGLLVRVFRSPSLLHVMRAWRSFPSHANEATGDAWKGNWTQSPALLTKSKRCAMDDES